MWATFSSLPDESSTPSASSWRNGSIAETIAYGKQLRRRLLTGIFEKRGDEGKKNIVPPRQVTVPATATKAEAFRGTSNAPRYVKILSACLSNRWSGGVGNGVDIHAFHLQNYAFYRHGKNYGMEELLQVIFEYRRGIKSVTVSWSRSASAPGSLGSRGLRYPADLK
jgi:hypothetical protein